MPRNQVTDLACDPSSGKEQGKGDANVRGDEHLTIERGENDREGQKDGIAGLIGGEAVVIGKGGSVLNAGHDCEEKEKRR